MKRCAQAAEEQLGGFDTWINNAGVSIYGRIEDIESDDMRRLFDTNFWGIVYGSRAALEHFRKRGAGKLINMGSVLGERAIPIQGIYSASKHAVAGFTESLRMEIDMQHLPVSITLIKPSAIDTPYKDHAKNYLDEAPRNPPPVYAPETVARAVTYACDHDIRDIVVGGGGQLISTLSNLAPRLTDRVMSRLMPYLQRSNEPSRPRHINNLHGPGDDLSERSNYPMTIKRSAYTRLQMQPFLSTIGLLAVGAGFLVLRNLATGSGSRRSRHIGLGRWAG